MRNRVLYFPYMRVPRSRWLTQLLLYWDQVLSIVPYEYTQKPEALGRYMCELLREGLVHQVIPGMYVHRMRKFDSAFLGYLDGLGEDMDRRRQRFVKGSAFKVHVEKMGEVSGGLVKQRLAREGKYPWYEVEKETADDFMSYLATTLGRQEKVDSDPITDNTAYLKRLARAGVTRSDAAQQLDSLRVSVLDAVLPVPARVIPVEQLRAFKEHRRGELANFRRRVEREIVEAAGINDPALRQRHLDIFFDEARDRIAHIQASMSGAGWRPVKAGLAVVAAIPGVSQFFGLASAVWEALGSGAAPNNAQDFAYAAYSRAELKPKAPARSARKRAS